MLKKQIFILAPAPHPARQNCLRAIHGAPDGMMVTIAEPTRTDRQNDMIQPMIREFAEKMPPVLVNGELTRLAPDDWRHILVARYRREEPRYALFGGTLIMLGASSKKLSVKECAEFIEFLHAEAADNGFQLSRVEAECSGLG